MIFQHISGGFTLDFLTEVGTSGLVVDASCRFFSGASYMEKLFGKYISVNVFLAITRKPSSTSAPVEITGKAHFISGLRICPYLQGMGLKPEN